MRGVVESWHLQQSPRPKPEWRVGGRMCRPCNHAGVGVSECLVQTHAFHLILDGTDHLLYVELRTSQLGFLLTEIVKLLLDLDLQLELLMEMRHFRIDTRIF